MRGWTQKKHVTGSFIVYASIVIVIKSRKIGWAWCMHEEKRNTCKMLFENPQGKRSVVTDMLTEAKVVFCNPLCNKCYNLTCFNSN
jgi:hypothetical protein